MSSVPFSDDLELIRLSGMVAAWIADLAEACSTQIIHASDGDAHEHRQLACRPYRSRRESDCLRRKSEKRSAHRSDAGTARRSADVLEATSRQHSGKEAGLTASWRSMEEQHIVLMGLRPK